MLYVQNRKANVGIQIYNNTLYALGGNNDDTTLKTISYIDIELLLTTSSSSNWDVYTWQSDTSTGVTYSYDDIRVSGSVIVDNLIYITGSKIAEMLVFDASTNSQKLFNTYNFTMLETATETALMSCAVTNQSHIFVIGGRETTGTYYNSTNKLQIYDISNDKWYYGDSMNIRRSRLECHFDEINNKIWALAGAKYGQYYPAGWVWPGQDTIEYYDLLTDKWTLLNDTALTYPRQALVSLFWTFPYDSIEELYNNKYGIFNYSSHLSRFPKYNKQFIYMIGGYHGLVTTSSNFLTENEVFEIENNENNVSASHVLPYDGLNDVSSAISNAVAIKLPSDYDTVNLTISKVNATHEKETIYIEKQYVQIGGYRPDATPSYQYWTFLEKLKYEESIFNEIPTTLMPSVVPSNIPSNEPTVVPSNIPIIEPTNLPSYLPSAMPSNDPSVNPTKNPSNVPTVEPSVYPSGDPTNSPSNAPSAMPSNDPTIVPSRVPSMIPTIYPTVNPTMDTIEPSKLPSNMPSEMPSMYPSMNPTFPTIMPTEIPLSSTTPETSQETTNINTDNDDNNAIIKSEDCKYVKFNCIFGCFLQDNNNNNNNNNNNSIFYFNPGARTVFDLKIEIYLTNTKIINAFKNATANANNNDNNNNSIIVSLSWNVHNNWNDETSKYENVLALLSYNWTINDDTFSIVNTIDEIGNYTNVDILTYDKFTVNIINDSYGIFIIDSNIVLYQSEMDGNMYSYDILYDINKYIDSIFDINKEYRVENEIRLYVNNEVIIENSDNVDLMGNAPISVNNENNNNNNTIYVNCNVEPNSININNNNDSYDLDVSCIFTKMHDLNSTFVNLIFDDSLFLFNEYESLFYLKRQENNTLSKKLRNIPIADGNHSIKLIALDDMDMGTLYYESDTMMFNCVINDNQYNEHTIEMMLEIMSSYEPDEQIEFVLTATTAYEIIMELGNTTLEAKFVDLVINFTMYNSNNDYFAVESNEVNGLLSLLHTITETSTSTIDSNMDVLLLLESSLDKYNKNSNNIVISESSADLLISILYNVMNNLMMATSSVVIDNEQRDEVGDLITSIVVKLGNLILLNGIVGEYYYFDEYMPLFEMKFAKIDENNFKECQINGNIDLYYANTLLDLKSNNGSNNINCIIMNTQCNIYNLTSNNNDNNNFHSNFILFELMNDNSTETNDNSVNRYDLPSCEPVLLSFNVTNDTWFNDADNSGHYPLCSFYNESREMYDSNGCYLLYNDSSRYVCACSHLTFFGLSSQDFEIEINYKPIYIISEWKLSLVFEYPFGMYVSLGWVLFMLLIVFIYLQCRNEIGQCMVLKEDRPLVLVAGASHVQKQVEYGDYRSVNDYSIIANSNMNLFEKSGYLAFNSLKNDHLWFGVCCRNHGSNYTTIERLFVLMLRVLITMTVFAIVYGITGSSSIDNWGLIFCESLLGNIAILGIKYCIEKSRPDGIENDCENETRTPLSPRKDEKKSVNTMASETEMMATIVNSKNNNNGNNDSNDNGATMTQANGEIVIQLKEKEEGNDDKYEIAGGMTIDQNENENENNMDMRNKVMNKEYPLNKNFKWFAYCLILLFSIICVIIVSIWCAYFDVSWKYKNNYENEIDSSQCIDNDYIDISNKVWLNYNSTNDYIDKLLSDNNNYNTTKSFLLEMLISHLVASLFWAPMIALLYRGVYKLFKKQGKQSGDGGGGDDTINEGKMYYQYQQKLKGKHTIK